MSATDRYPRNPASGWDQCSTSTCRAPARLRPTPRPMQRSRNPMPHQQRSRRLPATCTSRAAPSVRRRRHIPVAPRHHPARRCHSQRRRADRQPWSGEPPPPRARISVISSSCSLSCCSSEPFACGTRADAGPAVAAVRVPNRLAINAMRTNFTMEHSTSLDWKLLGRSPPEYRRLVLLRVSPSWTPDNERTSHRSAHSSLRVHPTGIGLSRATC